jgi:hypothetical protein
VTSTFARAWTFGLEASTRCKKCHFLLPINGPQRAVVCAKCGERRVLDRAAWDDILDTPVRWGRVMRPASTRSMQIGIDASALKLAITREDPRCRECEAPVDPADSAEVCAKCGKRLARQLPPPFIKRTHRTVALTWLGALDSETPVGAEEVTRWYVHCRVDPAEVELDRARATRALAKLESMLPPSSGAWSARRAVPGAITPDPPEERLHHAAAREEPEAPPPELVVGSAYRARPVRDAPEREAPVARRMKTSVALVLSGVTFALGWLLGYLSSGRW